MSSEVCAWSPRDWVCSLFPLPVPGVEVLALELLVRRLERMVDSCTEADYTDLHRALHVAHLLVARQGEDGGWPAVLNVRTGEAVGSAVSRAPVRLFRRLNTRLKSTEFDCACERAEEGDRCRVRQLPHT